MSHIVLYGHDDMLHLTRRWLLERLGFAVSTVNAMSDLRRICVQHPADLIVICYTVRAEECDEIIAAARLMQPEIKIALLSSLIDPNPCHAPAHVHIVLENPIEFTRSIRSILHPVAVEAETSVRTEATSSTAHLHAAG